MKWCFTPAFSETKSSNIDKVRGCALYRAEEVKGYLTSSLYYKETPTMTFIHSVL